MRFEHFTSKKKFIADSVTYILNAVGEKEGVAHIGLSGGKTPLPVYKALANSALNFERTEFWLVDERCVPPNNLDSNYGTIKKAFAKAPPVFFNHLHGFDTSLSPKDAAAKYEQETQVIPQSRFDLIILGMGSDGHIASLLPGSPALGETTALVAANINASVPNPPVRDRLTMTLLLLMKSRDILLLLTGKEKQSALNDLLEGKKSVEEFPVRQLMEHTEFSIFYLP